MTTHVTGPNSPFSVTFFTSAAASKKTESQCSLATLARRIETTTAREKNSLPWLKLATFGDIKTPLVPSAGGNGRMTGGSLRHDANLLTVTGIEADYDAEQVSFDDAVQCLTEQGVLGIVYTSPSHTENRQRWRVLCPLTTPALPEMRGKLLGRLNGLYRGIFSVESWTLSQAYYYGSVRSNPSHKVAVVDGTPIDQHDELEELWLGKPNTAFAKLGPMRCKSGRIKEAELLDQIVKGESYHAAAVRLLGLWALEGVPLTDAKIQLVTAMEAVFPPDRDSRWHERLADIDRCILDVYGKEAGRKIAANDTIQPAKGDRTVAVQWGEPVDFLSDTSMGAPRLDARHVPDALWPFIQDTSERMGVDRSAVAFIALATCASVIDDDWRVQPKRWDYTWTEQARLWAAIVGDPSILKSPVISACTRPIDKLEIEARHRHHEMMLAHQQGCEVSAKSKPPEPTAPPPKCDRYMVEGTTPEALSEVLRDGAEARFNVPCHKVLCRQDEMSEWFGGMDRYKAGGRGGSERGNYLRLYNGGRHTVDRVNRGSFVVQNWSACFVGGVQPGPIQRIAKEAADDGLIQRFMLCVPGRQDRGIDRPPNDQAIERYHTLIAALAALHPGQEIGGGDAKPITLAEEAHKYREHIDDLAHALQAMPDTTNRTKAALGKWQGLFARLCLTFHMISMVDASRDQRACSLKVVQADVATRVAEFMEHVLLPHMLRAEALMFSTDQTSHARWIASFILSHKCSTITSREITRAYGALRAPECKAELMSVMSGLQMVGWIEAIEPANIAKAVTTWEVNPMVHTMFAEQAAAEAERRTVVKAKLRNLTSRGTRNIV